MAQRSTKSVILGVGLAEAVAVCGLVRALISHQPMAIIPYAGAAIVLMLNHFPRLDVVIDRVKTARGY